MVKTRNGSPKTFRFWRRTLASTASVLAVMSACIYIANYCAVAGFHYCAEGTNVEAYKSCMESGTLPSGSLTDGAASSDLTVSKLKEACLLANIKKCELHYTSKAIAYCLESGRGVIPGFILQIGEVVLKGQAYKIALDNPMGFVATACVVLGAAYKMCFTNCRGGDKNTTTTTSRRNRREGEREIPPRNDDEDSPSSSDDEGKSSWAGVNRGSSQRARPRRLAVSLDDVDAPPFTADPAPPTAPQGPVTLLGFNNTLTRTTVSPLNPTAPGGVPPSQ
jgi:hypothetical protein